jgi:hypothetical protein
VNVGGGGGRGGELLHHHDLCFGCGRTNLFGLLAELKESGPGAVAGRCFIKQDHQGPEPGTAHPGVLAAALIEAMTHAAGHSSKRVEVTFEAPAPVGVFVDLEATANAATATAGGVRVATARSLPQD